MANNKERERPWLAKNYRSNLEIDIVSDSDWMNLILIVEN